MSQILRIETQKEAETFLWEHYQGGLYGLDCETEGIDPKTEAPAKSKGRIICWSLAWYSNEGVIKRAYICGSLLPLFKGFLEAKNTSFVGHNIFSFDYHMFLNHDIDLTNIVGDTVRMSKLADNNPEARHGLKPLGSSIFNYEMDSFKTLFSKPKHKVEFRDKPLKSRRKIGDQEKVPTYIHGEYWKLYTTRELISLSEVISNETLAPLKEKLYEYASLDAEVTLRLYHHFCTRLSDIPWVGKRSLLEFYNEIWNPSLYALVDAEQAGFTLDKHICDLSVRSLQQEADTLKKEIDTWAGKEVNWNSYKQVQEFLYEELALVPPPIKGTLKAIQRCKKGETPTSEAALDYLAKGGVEELRKVLKYKKDLKDIQVIQSLPERLDENNRLHYQLSPSTDTGRLSVKNPSVNCIKKGGDTRKAFIAGNGYKLIVADYSTLELRILAHFLAAKFDDWDLAEDLKEDLHQATADKLGITRDMAKVINFSINYGKTPKGLATQLGISKDEAEEILELYFETYPAIVRWQIYCESFAHRTGAIRTLLGRYREIPELAEEMYRGPGFRKAINTPIQGSAADLVTMAMLRTYTGRHLPQYYNATLARTGCKLICQVHDELIFRVPKISSEEALPLVKAAMENPLDKPLLVPTPVQAAIADSWYEGK